MATITLRITGIDDIMTNLQAKIGKLETAIDQAVQGAGIDTQAGAKQRARVDTGRFRAGYQYENQGLGRCRVYNTVGYGIFLELGHWSRGHKTFVGPFPSLVPAWQAAGQGLISELKAIRV